MILIIIPTVTAMLASLQDYRSCRILLDFASIYTMADVPISTFRTDGSGNSMQTMQASLVPETKKEGDRIASKFVPWLLHRM